MRGFLHLSQAQWMGMGLASCLAGIFYWQRKSREKVEGLLSAQVRAVKSKLYQRQRIQDYGRRLIETLYYPSAWSIGIPALIVLLVACMDVCFAPRWSTENDKLLSNLIAVETGLTAIIFPLVIFIIELTGDRSETGVKKSEIVLRESFLFPSVIFVLLCLLAFSFLGKLLSGLLLVLATTFVSIGVLFRVVRILMEDHKAIQIGRAVLKDKVRRGLHLAIDERIANNLLMQNLERLGVVPQLIGFNEDRDSVRLFRAIKFGTVVDVDFRRLDEVLQEIPFIEPGSRIFDAHRSDKDKEPKKPKVYFSTRIGDKMAEDRNVVLAIEKTVEFGDQHAQTLSAAVNEIVHVAATESYQEVLSAEISRLKDFMLVSIDEKRTGAIDIAADHYVAIAETFLEELARCNSIYSSKRAREEMGSLFGRWDAIENVAKDTYEFFERALETGNRDAIRLVGYIPIAISARALRFKDHYLFQKFTSFARYLYLASLEQREPRIKDFLADRAFRYVCELADYHIEPHLLKRQLDPAMLEDYGDFAMELLVVFQGLMKAAIDSKDMTGLQRFQVEMQKLFNRFEPDQESRSVQHLDMILSSPDLTPTQRAEFETAKKYQQSREAVRSRIVLRKKQILFGLSSWAYRLWRQQPSEQFYKDSFVLLLRAMG